MTEGERPHIRRILVGLDASAPSLVALETAAELAAALKAELEGFYVEDEELLRLVGTSVVREVDALSAELRQVERGGIERQLRFQARRARRALQLVADARRLRWTFRTQSGRVAAEVTSAAGQADLLVLGFRSGTPGRGPGSTVRALLARPGAPLLLLGRRARLGRSIFAVWDGSDGARRALGVAAAVAGPREVGVTVLLPGPAARGAPESREAAAAAHRGPKRSEAGDSDAGDESVAADRVEALRLLEAEDVTGRAIRLAGRGPDLREVAGIVRTAGCGLLVFPLPARPDERSLAELLATVDCPLLLVR